MMLCLDIGNTHLYGGLLNEKDIVLRFRFPSIPTYTIDTLGLLLRNVIRENHFDSNKVNAIGISSVMPAFDDIIVAACEKYFALQPVSIKPGITTGLILDTNQLGADRIANAVAALAQFPARNLAIFDFGTATTACAISKDSVYLGGAILPGFTLSMRALSANTALLTDVDIVQPTHLLGKNTESQLQIGIYYSQLGAAEKILQEWQTTVFKHEPALVIATGGCASLMLQQPLFTIYLPDLVLEGIRLIWQKNQPCLLTKK